MIFTGGFDFNWMNFVKVNVTAINPVKDDGISVYPNPTNNLLNITSLNFEYSHIEIYNIDGNCLLSKTVTYIPENVLYFSLSDGQYIISLSNPEQKKTVMFKVVR